MRKIERQDLIGRSEDIRHELIGIKAHVTAALNQVNSMLEDLRRNGE